MKESVNLPFCLCYRYIDPLTSGDYPLSMRSRVRNKLPLFSAEDSDMLKGSYDFLGLNYYTTYYARYAATIISPQTTILTDSQSFVTRKSTAISRYSVSWSNMNATLLNLSYLPSCWFLICFFLVSAYRHGVPIGPRVRTTHLKAQ